MELTLDQLYLLSSAMKWERDAWCSSTTEEDRQAWQELNNKLDKEIERVTYRR